MTPAQRAGLVVGKQYKLKPENDEGWPAGTIVTFKRDDQSSCPAFFVPEHLDSDGYRYIYVSDVEELEPSGVTFADTERSIKTTTIVVDRELTAEEKAAITEIIVKGNK